MNTKISAGALRSIGVEIPENIPDCAMAGLTGFRVQEPAQDGNITRIDIDLVLEPQGLEWIELGLTL